LTRASRIASFARSCHGDYVHITHGRRRSRRVVYKRVTPGKRNQHVCLSRRARRVRVGGAIAREVDLHVY
jgi:hypothetical protein